MKALIILECPSCLNPVTLTMPTKIHVDEDMQAYDRQRRQDPEQVVLQT